jgi:rare lipoprotein A
MDMAGYSLRKTSVALVFALSVIGIPVAASAQTGVASVYAYSGGRTASGEHVSPGALTAAHRSLPFGTLVRVTNERNGRSVVVRINDRGPFVHGRVIDVTPAAARALGFSGLAEVNLTVVGRS